MSQSHATRDTITRDHIRKKSVQKHESHEDWKKNRKIRA